MKERPGVRTTLEEGVLLVELWRSYPFFTLFFLAGLQSIPEELRDATAVDGASRWQHFRHVTMPLLRPVILVSSLLEGIRLANSPTLILLLTNGGARSRPFTLPPLEEPGTWVEVINTAHPTPRQVRQGRVSLVAHSLMLLRHERPR